MMDAISTGLRALCSGELECGCREWFSHWLVEGEKCFSHGPLQYGRPRQFPGWRLDWATEPQTGAGATSDTE